MNYLICQDWTNTSNNHAGIKYLCLQLEEKYKKNAKPLLSLIILGAKLQSIVN